MDLCLLILLSGSNSLFHLNIEEYSSTIQLCHFQLSHDYLINLIWFIGKYSLITDFNRFELKYKFTIEDMKPPLLETHFIAIPTSTLV